VYGFRDEAGIFKCGNGLSNQPTRKYSCDHPSRRWRFWCQSANLC
jgi:hypothetical protein